jgi:hypothetical protein
VTPQQPALGFFRGNLPLFGPLGLLNFFPFHPFQAIRGKIPSPFIHFRTIPEMDTSHVLEDLGRKSFIQGGK